MKRISLAVIGLLASITLPNRAMATSCTKASDCKGPLPQLCRICSDGATACFAWYCIDFQCHAELRCPPVEPTINIDVPGEWVGILPTGWTDLPDEHSSILADGNSEYLMFTAGTTPSGSGAVVLKTDHFRTFTEPPGYSSPVMSAFEHQSCGAISWENVYDNNYAAPGAVFPDPVANGTLLMLYEAEDHCRQNTSGGWTYLQEFYASSG